MYKLQYTPTSPLILGVPVYLGLNLRIPKLVQKNNRAVLTTSKVVYIGSCYVLEDQLQNLHRYSVEFAKMIFSLQEHDQQVVLGNFLSQINIVSNKDHIEKLINDTEASMYCIKNYLIIPFDYLLIKEISEYKLNSPIDIGSFIRYNSITEVMRIQNIYRDNMDNVLKKLRDSDATVDDSSLVGSILRSHDKNYYIYCAYLGVFLEKQLAEYIKAVCRICYRYAQPKHTTTDFMVKVKSVYNNEFLQKNLPLRLKDIVDKVLDFHDEEEFGLFVPLKIFRKDQMKNLN